MILVVMHRSSVRCMKLVAQGFDIILVMRSKNLLIRVCHDYWSFYSNIWSQHNRLGFCSSSKQNSHQVVFPWLYTWCVRYSSELGLSSSVLTLILHSFQGSRQVRGVEVPYAALLSSTCITVRFASCSNSSFVTAATSSPSKYLTISSKGT